MNLIIEASAGSNNYPFITTQEVEPCHFKCEYEMDPKIVEEAVEKSITEIRFSLEQQHRSLPGFRKGKLDNLAIWQTYNKQIRAMVEQQLLNTAYDDIIFQLNIKPIGQPILVRKNLNLKSFSCELEIISRPKFDLVKYKGFEVIEPPMSKTSEEIIEEYLENIRQQHCDTVPYSDDDFVTMEDQITFSYTGTCNGIVLPEYTSEEGVFYKVGEEKFVGFDQNLIGMRSGEERSFTLGLDGKNIEFNVNLFMGVKKVLKDFDESFFKSIGVADMDELMNKVSTVAGQILQTEKLNKFTEAVINHLVASNPIDVPQFLIVGEAKFALSCYRKKLEDFPEEGVKQLYAQSERNLKTSFILDAIRNVEPDAVLNDGEAVERIKQFTISRGQNPDDVLKSPALPQLIGTIKDEYVIQWVLSNSTIIPQ